MGCGGMGGCGGSKSSSSKSNHKQMPNFGHKPSFAKQSGGAGGGRRAGYKSSGLNGSGFGMPKVRMSFGSRK